MSQESKIDYNDVISWLELLQSFVHELKFYRNGHPIIEIKQKDHFFLNPKYEKIRDMLFSYNDLKKIWIVREHSIQKGFRIFDLQISRLILDAKNKLNPK